ncbi:hypothetical protein M8J77_001963 [Diaphorina citri]|nr:hypothetical protein M8J77_001963 [Diaphorina citri]
MVKKKSVSFEPTQSFEIQGRLFRFLILFLLFLSLAVHQDKIQLLQLYQDRHKIQFNHKLEDLNGTDALQFDSEIIYCGDSSNKWGRLWIKSALNGNRTRGLALKK